MIGLSLPIQEQTNTNNTAEKLTLNWNCKNFLILSKIFLPHFIAWTIELKLSSKIIISAASLATSVPVLPIANPTSAFDKAEASFVPSPVTATTLSNSLKPSTKAYLSIALALAITFKFLIISLNESISCTLSFFNFLAKSSSSSNSGYFILAWPMVLGQLHFSVSIVQVLQTIPPILSINCFPVIDK